MSRFTTQAFFSLFAVIFIFLQSPSLRAASSLLVPTYEARYSVIWRGMSVGESVHTLEETAPDTYRLVSDTDPHLRFLPYDYFESASFTMENGTLRPQIYTFDAHEGVKKKKGVLTFNWQDNVIQNNKEKAPWETVLYDGMFDKLTHTLAMRLDLIEGKSDLVYNVVEEGKIRAYRFVIVGEETMETALGTTETLKLEHVSRRGKRRTNLWVSKEHDYLLVRMQQFRKGKLIAGGDIVSYTPT